MQFKPKNSILKFQQGGPMELGAPMAEEPVEGGAPAQEEDPMMMLAQAAMQALQSQDCQMAMLVCQGLVQVLQQMAQGGQQLAPEGEPVFKKGGILLRRIKK